MTGLVTWAVARARMIVALVLLSIGAGMAAYVGLPKEGSPNIDVPVLYVSVALPGVSAEDSERLLVRPLEAKLRGLEGMKEMQGVASEGHAGLVLEFDFGWDKTRTISQVRALVDEAQAEMPADALEPTINEVNLSAFPILVISLSGSAPERTLQKLARDMQRDLEALTPVLEVGVAGARDELIEVIVDPIKLESYDVTVPELLQVVSANNALVAAGAVESRSGRFSLRVPGNFETAQEINETPVRVSGDRMVTIGDIAEIRRTFEDRTSVARYDGRPTVALQVKKRLGYNIIDAVEEVKARARQIEATWPDALRTSVHVTFSMDQSVEVQDMVGQLEGSVLTAVGLVILVVVLTLGGRSAGLVGLSIPLSFLLTFAVLAAFGMSVNNMVMFGLILAVGMLVDGAIVVSEYADRRMTEGAEPESAYAEAARRMFWPVTASTATTLCAFLPMLFWPGMPGQFMGQLPITLIFVLSASLVVALIFLPVLGGVLGRASVNGGRAMRRLGGRAARPGAAPLPKGARRTLFGRLISLVVTNPLGPALAIGAACGGIYLVYDYYGGHNRGVEFFVETEPQRAILYVRARGNLSLEEKDRLVADVERRVIGVEGVAALFSFAGDGGLQKQGGEGPKDSVGELQFELERWGERRDGKTILAEIVERAQTAPGVIVELAEQKDGPQQGKPIQIRLEGFDWPALQAAAGELSDRLSRIEGLREIEDTRPLPGIDWRVKVDREAAGRFGADVQTIGAVVSLVTRGALLDVMRPDDSDEEIDIRVRFPQGDRVLTTLERVKLRTQMGLVPLSNLLTVTPAPALAEITRMNGSRILVVKANVDPGVNVNEKIAEIAASLQEDPLQSVRPVFQGDQEEQEESQQFLMTAFAGALGLMFAILLAQFNSVYNSVLVLSAVVMSVTGVLIGMMVMDQTFSIIMTGTGIVALAGIVVNNNIVLIDTFQELSRSMPPLEAIVRTAETRIRPVMLTTITTMAGLAPMMFAASINFDGVGPGFAALMAAGPLTAAGWAALYGSIVSVGAPVALWWTQLATAVVFGLGVSTVLTLVVTPSALAARVWFWRGVGWLAVTLAGGAQARADRRLRARSARIAPPEILWEAAPPPPGPIAFPPRAYADAAE
ncbi:efflux RND transporter permease subunit [Rubrimonas cliftonensis]|uniref:Multidrug efflux pump n=1 Tax=Rubrimonas cliftonensis TaxID=89524 RepID=A0A1H3ZF50_9RHOB|nr:efflux RND transporter permease subunit [Rubrimonas cliftonensis]SEA22267.1 multidrug efflux pump [Rubrimonas cliftonensis]